MTINLDTLRKTVENAGEAWADGEHIDIITPETVLALLSRLEQAEQAVVLAKAECTRQKHQKGILFRRTTEAEQQVARVREVATGDPTEYGWSEAMLAVLRALDGDTRRLADQGLGDNLARTTKSGGA